MAKTNTYCPHCANTGVLWAATFKDAETKERGIMVEVCEDHSNTQMAEKSVEAMKASGLRIVVVGPGNKPKYPEIEAPANSGIQKKITEGEVAVA